MFEAARVWYQSEQLLNRETKDLTRKRSTPVFDLPLLYVTTGGYRLYMFSHVSGRSDLLGQ